MLQLREQPLGDAVIVTFAMPLRHDFAGRRIDRARVALAQMYAEGDSVEPGNDGVIGRDRTLHVFVRILAAGAHAVERNLVDIGGVARRIDLDITAAGIDQFTDDLPRDFDDVGKERVHIRINGLGLLPVEALRNPVGTQHRHLDGPRRDLAGKLVFRKRHVAHQAEPLDDAAPGSDRRAGRAEILFGAHQRLQAHAFHRFVLGGDLET